VSTVDFCNRDTDKLTQQTGAVAPTTNLRQEAVKLYEQFFEVCQRPNEAEIALLSRVGGTNAARVTEWCMKLFPNPQKYSLTTLIQLIRNVSV